MSNPEFKSTGCVSADIDNLFDLIDETVKTFECVVLAHKSMKARIAYCEAEIKKLHMIIHDIDEEKGEIEDELVQLRELAEFNVPDQPDAEPDYPLVDRPDKVN